MSKCLSLPGIQQVWYILRDYLPDDVVYRSVAGIPISLEVVPDEIALKVEAVCEVEQLYDNNSYIEKAKLTFLTLDDVPTDQHPAFVIRTVNDEYYVIGALRVSQTVTPPSESTRFPLRPRKHWHFVASDFPTPAAPKMTFLWKKEAFWIIKLEKCLFFQKKVVPLHPRDPGTLPIRTVQHAGPFFLYMIYTKQAIPLF